VNNVRPPAADIIRTSQPRPHCARPSVDYLDAEGRGRTHGGSRRLRGSQDLSLVDSPVVHCQPTRPTRLLRWLEAYFLRRSQVVRPASFRLYCSHFNTYFIQIPSLKMFCCILPRNTYAHRADSAVARCLVLSVCLSVTRRYCVETDNRIVRLFSLFFHKTGTLCEL